MKSFQDRRRHFVRSFLLALGAVLTFGAAQEALAAFPPIQEEDISLWGWESGLPATGWLDINGVCSSKLVDRCMSNEGAALCTCASMPANCDDSNDPIHGHRTVVEASFDGGAACQRRWSLSGSHIQWFIYKWRVGSGSFCPAGSTLTGGQCVCNSGYAESGSSCVARNKNLGGKPDPILCLGNPCNAGTGTKFQVETVYRGGGSSQLLEQLSYNSRLLSDAGLISSGAYGKGWKGNYERQITVHGVLVIVRRADGRELDFRPPPSGNVYVADADVADRLERLVDGSGNTTGWKYFVAADDSAECAANQQMRDWMS